MRTITSHQTNAANRAITIDADERDPENGNASHDYDLVWRKLDSVHEDFCKIRFQHGPIAEVGVNGITNEALLAIVIDRLEGFQSSKYANDFNKDALEYTRRALSVLEERTKSREARGVEGTHEV